LIAALLPAGVAWAERYDDEVPGELYPVEEAAIARAVGKRRREFITGRWCARQALAGLGVAPVAIPRGDRGAPAWPPGIVGALTHCAGYRAAIVAPATAYMSVGLDAEPDEPLPDGVLDTISLPGERERLTRLAAGPSWERLLFSAKESVYKAWFPLARRWLDFTECDVTLAEDGTFAARLLVAGPVPGFRGRWVAAGGLVATVIVQPAAVRPHYEDDRDRSAASPATERVFHDSAGH
jgi:4'-phosphopantetheinyl transferase EntD